MLRNAFGHAEVQVFQECRPMAREELLARVVGIEGLLPMLTDRVDRELLETAGPQLRVVANYAVGYNNIDVAAATERGVAVTNTPDVLTETTADLAWALLMAAARRLGEAERVVRAGGWRGWGPQFMLGVDVHGKTLGIVGLGRIGRAMARRAAGFDMRILYYDAQRLAASEEHSLGVEYAPKPLLLCECDFISIHVPLSPDTRHLFSGDEFKAMKRTACLVNTSRGPVVDEAALAQALRDGEIFAAGLDVFEEEPKVLPELLECENAVLIPHLGSATHETRAKMAETAAANVIAALEERDPPNCVNPEVL